MYQSKFLFLILFTLECSICKSKIIPRRDWSKVDLDEVDRQWSVEDNEGEEIITKDEELILEGERRRAEAMKKINELIKSNPKGHGPGSMEFERLAQGM
jgi:hypothetical protein